VRGSKRVPLAGPNVGAFRAFKKDGWISDETLETTGDR
jgi:hypothetical protein